MSSIIGWDLGGANLKLARVEDGCVVQVAQIPCPIRQDRSKFDDALAEALKVCRGGTRHAATMTGELSDVFADRREGVSYLVAMMRGATGDATPFYGTKAGFLDADDAVEHYLDVASANWHASARLVATKCPDGLFIDAGTTTTDIIPLKSGSPAAFGSTDAERLAEGELIYAGVVRTPVMALTREVPFKGRMQRIAAERFATMADVWQLVGELPADADPYPTPDLRGKSADESAARLARMLGRDLIEAELPDWIAVASYLAECQLADIETAARALILREGFGLEAPVIGAGCGRFMARTVAQRLGRAYRDFDDMINCDEKTREMAARAAPAVAVALLAEQHFTPSTGTGELG
jgi:probable H4MPT-linked C1 transfer pathway protein